MLIPLLLHNLRGFINGFWKLFQLHGTYRRKDRVYREDIFYGQGKALNEVSAEELQADMEERNSENPLAYRENQLVYKLNKTDVNGNEKKQKSN